MSDWVRECDRAHEEQSALQVGQAEIARMQSELAAIKGQCDMLLRLLEIERGQRRRELLARGATRI